MDENTAKPEDFYKEEVKITSNSVMLGHMEYTETIKNWETNPLVIAFWNDNDIQEMTVTSSNMGFVKTFTKQLKEK